MLVAPVLRPHERVQFTCPLGRRSLYEGRTQATVQARRVSC